MYGNNTVKHFKKGPVHMRIRMISLMSLGFITWFASQGYAASLTPLQVSIWNPVQLFSQDSSVYGLRLDLPYGNNKNVYGLDIGLFNQISEHGGGIQAGIDNGFMSSYLSWTPDQSFSGIRLGICNGGSNFKGFQSGLVNYYNPNVVEDEKGGNFSGISIGGVNLSLQTTGFQFGAGNSADMMNGIQFGQINAVRKKLTGVQISFFLNMADEVEGFQLGLVNYTRKMRGIQVGVVNIIRDSPLFFWPIANAYF